MVPLLYDPCDRQVPCISQASNLGTKFIYNHINTSPWWETTPLTCPHLCGTGSCGTKGGTTALVQQLLVTTLLDSDIRCYYVLVEVFSSCWGLESEKSTPVVWIYAKNKQQTEKRWQNVSDVQTSEHHTKFPASFYHDGIRYSEPLINYSFKRLGHYYVALFNVYRYGESGINKVKVESTLVKVNTCYIRHIKLELLG